MNTPKGKHAWTVKVGEKGQIVIPKEARDLFGIHPGSTLIILGDEQQGMAIPLQSMFSEVAEKVFGTRNSEKVGEEGKEDGE
ncbi:MAG: AbrB/MazE/SpoVT family DNA-binding domain-containing protein [Spirochaetia bacterium]|nr:AbrB/MazE/SpoVT family DNA-binding domain-containing protein [Spirochaetia bacterium]